MSELSTKHRNEHREWKHEHVEWLEELARWRHDREEALELFREIEYALRFPDPRWEPHHQSMVALEQELTRHQHHLEHGGDNTLEQSLHDATRSRQAHERAWHAQLKARHESVMQHVRALHNLVAGK